MPPRATVKLAALRADTSETTTGLLGAPDAHWAPLTAPREVPRIARILEPRVLRGREGPVGSRTKRYCFVPTVHQSHTCGRGGISWQPPGFSRPHIPVSWKKRRCKRGATVVAVASLQTRTLNLSGFDAKDEHEAIVTKQNT